MHTPGHTRGHLVYHDAAAQLMFAGDHVLPHITPSIGFEAAGNRMALSDYLGSLARMLALPDARLLPAHGPVTGSTHERVRELLAHHDTRLAETLSAVQAGHATAFEVAKAIKWTRHHREFADLDLFSQVLAVNETAAHLEVLASRGQVTHSVSADGTDLYQVAPAVQRPTRPLPPNSRVPGPAGGRARHMVGRQVVGVVSWRSQAAAGRGSGDAAWTATASRAA